METVNLPLGMKRLLPALLLVLSACSPTTSTASQTPASPPVDLSSTPQASSASPSPAPSQALPVSPAANPSAPETYSGTAYLKGLGIKNDGSYEAHVNFRGSATLLPNDQVILNLSTECGEGSAVAYQTGEITIQLNPQTKTWKELNHEYIGCFGETGTLSENQDEQYQPYTMVDAGSTVKFNLGTNNPAETYHFTDFYGIVLSKQPTTGDTNPQSDIHNDTSQTEDRD